MKERGEEEEEDGVRSGEREERLAHKRGSRAAVYRARALVEVTQGQSNGGPPRARYQIK